MPACLRDTLRVTASRITNLRLREALLVGLALAAYERATNNEQRATNNEQRATNGATHPADLVDRPTADRGLADRERRSRTRQTVGLLRPFHRIRGGRCERDRRACFRRGDDAHVARGADEGWCRLVGAGGNAIVAITSRTFVHVEAADEPSPAKSLGHVLRSVTPTCCDTPRACGSPRWPIAHSCTMAAF
jgi:hypothetical protein